MLLQPPTDENQTNKNEHEPTDGYETRNIPLLVFRKKMRDFFTRHLLGFRVHIYKWQRM